MYAWSTKCMLGLSAGDCRKGATLRAALRLKHDTLAARGRFIQKGSAFIAATCSSCLTTQHHRSPELQAVADSALTNPSRAEGRGGLSSIGLCGQFLREAETMKRVRFFFPDF